MKYQINVSNVKSIQNNIWDRIKGTFLLRKGEFGEPLPIYGHYGGVFRCGDSDLVIHTDGVGTKLLVAQELDKYDTVGMDAIAMSVNDILCMGAEPIVGVDYIALAKEDSELVAQIMDGLVRGCVESRCALIGGETAMIPDIIKGGKRPFDLTFTVVGRIKKLIVGDKIVAGDVIIGLESSGIHSNGYSLARRALDIKKWGAEMLVPTRIYVKPVLAMLDSGCVVHGIAHITGGAFSKITRLNANVGYIFDNLPEPKPIFKALAEKVGDEAEMYRTFNMGVGMTIVVPQSESNRVLEIAKKHGVPASIVGKVVERKGVWLKKKDGKELDISISAKS